MPKLAGVNVLGILVAAIAMFFIGFLWYGVLFQTPWMESNAIFWANEGNTSIQWLSGSGVTTQEMGMDPMVMGLGFVLFLVLSYGLGWHMKQKNISTLKTAVLFGLWISLLIGVPMAAYDFVYTPYGTLDGFLVDASHTVATFVGACAVLSFFD